MAFVLTGHRYIGTGTQPTAVPGYELVDTATGNLYAASTTGNTWNLIGSVNSDNFGMLPRAGGAMSGNPTGAHGFAPLDSPDFTSSAKIDGIDIITSADLTRMERTINSGLSPQITKAVRSTVTGVTARDSIAIGTGVLVFTPKAPFWYGVDANGFTPPDPKTIPLPVYADGTTADETECKWFVSIAAQWLPCGTSPGGRDVQMTYTADPMTSRTFTAYGLMSFGPIYTAVSIAYIIIGVRA